MSEIDDILDAIKKHGTPPEDEGCLAGILYRADKLSRLCFSCGSSDSCNWSSDKKNASIKY